jgi:hypothetical protein
MVGPNPHEQRGIEAHRRERVGRLDRPLGQQIGDRSRRIVGAIALIMILMVVAVVIVGWLDIYAART